jgi:hypothetical protein
MAAPMPADVEDKMLKESRGPTSRHARIRAEERLMNRLSPQRQQDILNRLKKGHGLDLSRRGRDRDRYYLEDNGEHLVVVANPQKTAIVTLWTLEPGTRAYALVEAHLAPIREAARQQAEREQLEAARALKAAQDLAAERERQELRALMAGEGLKVPATLTRARDRQGFSR